MGNFPLSRQRRLARGVSQLFAGWHTVPCSITELEVVRALPFMRRSDTLLCTLAAASFEHRDSGVETRNFSLHLLVGHERV